MDNEAEIGNKIQAAVDQVKADLADLERCVPSWDSGSIYGTKKYRPIARRIVASAQRVKELVHEHTY